MPCGYWWRTLRVRPADAIRRSGVLPEKIKTKD